MVPKIIILALIAAHYTDADDVKAYSDVVYQASGAQYLRWSVEVYRYTDGDGVPEHTCGGSLVKPAVVISAARCFWINGEQQPASRFAVARSWGGILFDTEWHTLQKSEVRTIHLPPSFRDRAGMYADDIAVLTLATPLRGAGVAPICVSFDEDLDRRQLAEGNFGRNMGTLQNAGYGLPSPLHTALEVRYVTRERCANESEPYHREQLTPDKICVGFKQSLQSLCRSDHGSGLAFYSGTSHAAIPYLRGVASTPFPNDPHGTTTICSMFRYAAFTHIASQRAFLERHVPGLEATCGQHYAIADVGDNTTAGVGDYFECNCFCNNKTST